MYRFYQVLIFIAIGTAFLGEFKIQPFDTNFRFGLGSMFFLFCIVFWSNLPLRSLSFMVGLTTVLWRVGADVLAGFPVASGLVTHLPAASYYLTCGFFMNNIGWWQWRAKPLHLGAIIFLADFAGNLVEMLVRSGFTLDYVTPQRLWFISVVATVRGLAVILLANTLLSERFRATKAVENEQFAERVLVGSNLHQEAFYLRKSMANIETVMKRSHDLYKALKYRETQPDMLAGAALEVAKEIHEIKKDLRRMEDGINQMLAAVPTTEVMALKNLLELVVGANVQYALSLQKEVSINLAVVVDGVTKQVFPLVSILNNLVQNAVEAMVDSGCIKVMVEIVNEQLVIKVEDNGPGIPAEERDIIFEPGFTTKFAADGQPSTGIGLTHVKGMVEDLGGIISLHTTNGQGSIFQIELPVKGVLETRGI